MAFCYRGLDKGDVTIDSRSFLEVEFELDLDGSAEFGQIKRWDLSCRKKKDEPRLSAEIEPIGLD